MRIAIFLAVMIAFLELAVRFIVPQPELHPRYRYSERYGHLPPASATIVNQLPGAWRFVYTTNEYGYRVSMPEISSRYDRPNVVVLGDSYTFGVGVNDGEEYPALLAKRLGASAGVVNLGVGGFGLTQEIRTFYEFGLLFEPALVVLQFCSNDPHENLHAKVTSVEDGRFRFHRDRSSGALRALKDWLGDSFLQRSAAYNLVRNQGFRFYQAASESRGDGIEAFHNQLLSAFADDLRRRGIRLVLFGVPGQLARWPGIERHVEALERQGALLYLRSEPWFERETDFASPEGHTFGVKGHRIVAEHLLLSITRAFDHGTREPAAAAAH